MHAPWTNRIIRHADVPPDQLLANPNNYRRHPVTQQDALSGVIGEIGFLDPVIATQSGMVIDGHLRVELAMRQNQPTIPVTYVNLTDDEANLALATMDPLSAMAFHDQEQLESLLASVSTDDAAVQALLDSLTESATITPGLTDPDDVPAVPAEPITKPGDLWILGRHRLGCLDATNVQHVDQVMDGQRAAACITDPPYNVEIDYGTHKDDYSIAEYQDFSREWSNAARLVSDVLLFTPGTGRGPGMPNFRLWYDIEAPFWILIWVKTNTVGHSSIGGFNAWEPIFLYGKPKKKIGQDIYDIPLTVQQDVADDEGRKWHPTPKQVSLWSALTEDFTDSGDLIFDPFAGSGTAIIVAEKTGRSCYAMELDPGFCDLIVTRWERYTGNTAIRQESTSAMAAD